MSTDSAVTDLAAGRVASPADAAGRIHDALGGRGPCHKFTCRCPAHDDARASLSVTVKGEQLLVRCHAGCAQDAVIGALRAEGLWPRPDRPAPAPRPPFGQATATYLYADADGAVVKRVERNARKDFRQSVPDEAGGWRYSVQGARDTLYRLPDVLAAVAGGRAVFFAEGEKDADNGAAAGLCVTTLAGGASAPHPAADLSPLAGAHVVLLPDNDDPGRRYARAMAPRLAAVARSVRVLELPGLPDKGDLSDWLAAGGTKARLLKLAKGAEVIRPAESLPGVLSCVAKVLAGQPAAVREQGLDIFPEARGAEREQIFRLLLSLSQETAAWFRFALGDAYNSLPGDYGAHKEWVERVFGADSGLYHQIRQYGWIAGNWPLTRRRKGLPWSFYKATAALTLAQQESYVARWFGGGLTISKIEEECRGRHRREAKSRGAEGEPDGGPDSGADGGWEGFPEALRGPLREAVERRGIDYVKALLERAAGETDPDESGRTLSPRGDSVSTEESPAECSINNTYPSYEGLEEEHFGEPPDPPDADPPVPDLEEIPAVEHRTLSPRGDSVRAEVDAPEKGIRTEPPPPPDSPLAAVESFLNFLLTEHCPRAQVVRLTPLPRIRDPRTGRTATLSTDPCRMANAVRLFARRINREHYDLATEFGRCAAPEEVPFDPFAD